MVLQMSLVQDLQDLSDGISLDLEATQSLFLPKLLLEVVVATISVSREVAPITT